MISSRIPPTLARGLGALAWLACLAMPAPRFARANQGGRDVSGEAGANASTMRTIKDAVAEYEARHFEEARALFRRALAIEPSARTLRGIGMASFELRDYVAATQALSASLIEPRRPLTPEQRQHVQGLLTRAETFVGRFTLRITPSDGELTVDGQPVEREADGTVLLPFGHHRLVLGCPTCAPAERAVEVAGGERRDLNMVASPVEPSASGDDTPMKAGVVAGAQVEDRPTAHRPAARWLGAAAILAAGGAVAGALWWHNRTDELETCESAGASCLNESTVSSQRNLAIGATVGLGIAALAAGAAATVLWHRADRGANVALGCASDMKAVICEVTF